MILNNHKLSGAGLPASSGGSSHRTLFEAKMNIIRKIVVSLSRMAGLFFLIAGGLWFIMHMARIPDRSVADQAIFCPGPDCQIREIPQ